jgi:TPR repeat protein
MYYNGKGVKQDYHQAVKFYTKACNGGNTKACNNLKNIKARMNAQTELFGLKLKLATRDDFWKTLKTTKVQVKTQDKNQWGDTYLTANELKGSSELYVGYTYDNKFAVAEYTFPGRMNTQLVLEIKNMVSSKYGEPNSSDGTINLGRVTYTWNLQDGIELKVYRGWPDTTVYVAYKHPENYALMQKAIDEQKQKKQQNQYQTQQHAF